MANTRPQCAADACTVPSRHLPDCPGECRGCLPGLADDGLQLCRHHTRKLGETILTIAARHRQLALVLTGTGRPGERTSGGNKNPNMSLNLRAAAVRRDIEALLRGTARLVCDERGFAWPTEGEGRRVVLARPAGLIGPLPLIQLPPDPTDRIPPIARLAANSATWLAGHERAGELSARLGDLASRAYGVAFPAGTRVFELPGLNGERHLACPEQVVNEDGPKSCPGALWTILRRDGDRLPPQIMCNHDDQHQWPSTAWIKLGRRMLKAAA